MQQPSDTSSLSLFIDKMTENKPLKEKNSSGQHSDSGEAEQSLSTYFSLSSFSLSLSLSK